MLFCYLATIFTNKRSNFPVVFLEKSIHTRNSHVHFGTLCDGVFPPMKQFLLGVHLGLWLGLMLVLSLTMRENFFCILYKCSTDALLSFRRKSESMKRIFLLYVGDLRRFLPDGMSQGHSPTMDVDLCRVKVQHLDIGQHDHTEGLIDLPHMDIFYLQPCCIQDLLRQTHARARSVNSG